MSNALNLQKIRATAALVAPYVVRTPTHRWRSLEIDRLLGRDAEVHLKLELFQQSGTFKARGAVAHVLGLSAGARERGVTAVSAGNHAIAVAYAANVLGASAKVVMQNTASPARIEAARAFGAEVVMEEPGPKAFALAEQIAKDEGRTFIHPFEGLTTALGTAGVGLELCEQVTDLDVVLVAVGGGGLAAGVSSAVKLMQPECEVIGIEPEGADSIGRSVAAGSPQTMTPNTIADSLAPPMALPFSFEVCRNNIDQLVTISDDAMRDAMSLLFREMKFAVEPACAATTAALIGPLREQLEGKRVGAILCGSNMHLEGFVALVAGH